MYYKNLFEMLSQIESDSETAARVNMKNAWITEEELHSDLTEETVERLVQFVCDFMNLDYYPDIRVYEEDSDEDFSVPGKLFGACLMTNVSYNHRHLTYFDEDSRVSFLRGLVHETRYIKQPALHIHERKGSVIELSPVELDAEAFAILFCDYFLAVAPTFESSELGEKLKEKVESMRFDFRNSILIQRKEGKY